MAALLKQSTTVTIRLGPALDKTDGVTEETALSPTVEISKNHGAFAARNSATAITHDSNGWYAVELNTTDTGTLGPFIAKFDDAATHLPVWREFLVVPANVYDSLVGGTDTLQADVTQWLGTAAATPTVAGVPEVDVTHWIGTAAATPTVAGVPEVDVTHWIGTAAATPTVAGVPEVDVTHVIGVLQTSDFASIIAETNDIQSRLPGALVGGRMDASVGAMDANVITAAAISGGAATDIRALASGTADSGTTTTMVDAARTEADTDYWKGLLIAFTSGTLNGQTRLVTAFDPATDTITFAPATTAAVSTHAYELIPAGRVDLGLILGAAVSTTTAQLGVNAVQWAGTATATTDIALKDTLAKTTDITGFTDLSAAQVNAEVVDALATDTYAEPGQGTPAATATLASKIGYVYKAWRNRTTQTSSQLSLYNDDALTVDQKATFSDDGTTADRGEVATGP